MCFLWPESKRASTVGLLEPRVISARAEKVFEGHRDSTREVSCIEGVFCDTVFGQEYRTGNGYENLWLEESKDHEVLCSFNWRE